MSRPRTPYGPNPPGRLPATMVKVLAAELSDPGRLSRGKRYWTDGAVIDIVVGHGAVTAEVQGGRAAPYIVTLEAAAGTGVPTRRELWVQCSCPDDDGAGTTACKHAVAALFALSDEIAIEPDLVDRWRHSRRTPAAEPHPSRPEPNDEASPVGGRERSPTATAPEPPEEPWRDDLAVLLAAPGGAAPPSFDQPEPLRHPPLDDPLLDDVLRDALDHLEIRWA